MSAPTSWHRAGCSAGHGLTLSGAALGAGLNTHREFGARVATVLTRRLDAPFVVASNLFAAMIAHSLVGLTALVPHIGYDCATRIARHAHVHGLDLRPAALEAGCISAADHDTWVDLRGMSEPV